MDPVSALSVAAAAVQFVDFSGHLISQVMEIYRDTNYEGVLPEYEELGTVTERLRAANASLKLSLDENKLKRSLTTSENELVAVANDCNLVATDLQRVLKKLKFDGRQSRWDKLQKAVKGALSKEKIVSLQQRLDSLRQQLIVNILVDLR
jgi:hypothetical protein